MKRILHILLLYPIINLTMDPVPLTPRDKKKAFKTLLKISRSIDKNERARAEEERKFHAIAMDKIALLNKEVCGLATAETIAQDYVTVTGPIDIPRHLSTPTSGFSTSSPSATSGFAPSRDRKKSIAREKYENEADNEESSGEKK
jgi:hypothetical protein